MRDTAAEAVPDTSLMKEVELASVWRVSRGHLANLRSRGEGPRYVKIGSAVRYRRCDVAAYELENLAGAA